MGIEGSSSQSTPGHPFFELVQPRPLEIKFRDFLVAVKRAIERTHRRVVDPSENVTPNNRYELPMGIESRDRGFEIPIESQVG